MDKTPKPVNVWFTVAHGRLQLFESLKHLLGLDIILSLCGVALKLC